VVPVPDFLEWLAANGGHPGGGAIGVALVVALDSGCIYYAGASGALHGWAAGGALLWWKGTPAHDRPQRRLAMALLCGVF